MSPQIASLNCARACLAALSLLSACQTTPLDVVYAADVGAIAGTAAGGAAGGAAAGAAAGGAGAGGVTGAAGAATGGAANAEPCSFMGAGLYALRSRANGLCLGQGAPTTVFGSPAFSLEFSADCRHSARSWQLSPTAVPSVFSVRNLSSGYVLDVYTAAMEDGTRVITYAETGFDNQRFEVRPRDPYAFELRPQHQPQSCVGATVGGAQISACDAADSTQAWLLQLSSCL